MLKQLSAKLFSAIVLMAAIGLLGWQLRQQLHQQSHQQFHQPVASQEKEFAVARAQASDNAHTRAQELYNRLPLHFEANQGQVDSNVKFFSQGAGYQLFLTDNEALLS